LIGSNLRGTSPVAGDQRTWSFRERLRKAWLAQRQ
jgi:hypothetical protein